MNVQITSTYRTKLIEAALLGALALVCGVSSKAADSEEVRQVVVRFGDLNLSDPRGATTLYGRISAAAREVCVTSDFESRDFGTQPAVNACMKRAISDAVTKVGRNELFAVYNAKNRPPLGLPVASCPKPLMAPAIGSVGRWRLPPPGGQAPLAGSDTREVAGKA